MDDTSWGEMLSEECKSLGEEMITCTLTPAEMAVKFDSGYGGVEGVPFTAWTNSWVLFPVGYDGAEWVGHAPRNPCDIKMEHQGGGC